MSIRHEYVAGLVVLFVLLLSACSPITPGQAPPDEVDDAIEVVETSIASESPPPTATGVTAASSDADDASEQISSDVASEATAAPAAAPEQTTITVWLPNVALAEALGEQIEQFEKGVGGAIAVEIVVKPQYYSELLSSLAGGIGPDVFMLYDRTQIVEFNLQGTLVPLDDYLFSTNNNLPEDLLPGGRKSATVQGRLHGAPWLRLLCTTDYRHLAVSSFSRNMYAATELVAFLTSEEQQTKNLEALAWLGYYPTRTSVNDIAPQCGADSSEMATVSRPPEFYAFTREQLINDSNLRDEADMAMNSPALLPDTRILFDRLSFSLAEFDEELEQMLFQDPDQFPGGDIIIMAPVAKEDGSFPNQETLESLGLDLAGRGVAVAWQVRGYLSGFGSDLVIYDSDLVIMRSDSSSPQSADEFGIYLEGKPDTERDVESTLGNNPPDGMQDPDAGWWMSSTFVDFSFGSPVVGCVWPVIVGNTLCGCL